MAAADAHACDRAWRLALWALLLLCTGIRCHHIDTPPAGEHAWRQADTAAVARNYLTEDADFFRPRVDRRGDTSGIGGGEFPLLGYATFLLYLVLGFHDWIGRAVVLSASVVASLLLYRHVRGRSGAPTAFATVAAMNGAPLFLYYSRCMMPDVVATAWMLAALLTFGRWLESARARWLLATGVFAALAILVKPSTGILLFGVAFCMLRRFGLRVFARPLHWLFAAITLLPFAWWYGCHVPWLNATFGLGDYFHTSPHTAAGLDDLLHTDLLYRLIKHQLLGSYAARPALVFLIVLGATWRRRSSGGGVRDPIVDVYRGWAVGFAILVLLDARMFRHHPYYGLPVVPLLAIGIGRGVGIALRWAGDQVWRHRLVWGTLAAAILLGIAGCLPKLAAGPDRAAIAAVTAVLPAGDLVVVHDPQYAVELYLLQRKGWSAMPDTDAATIREWLRRGAHWIVSGDSDWEQRDDIRALLAEGQPVPVVGPRRVFAFR